MGFLDHGWFNNFAWIWRESPTQAVVFLLAFYLSLVGAKVAIVVALAATRHRMSARTYRLILMASGILLLITAVVLIFTHVLR